MSITKRPWKISKYKATDASVRLLETRRCEFAGSQVSIATIDFHRTAKINEANAQLIVSAPELLEACKAFMKEWDSPKSDRNPKKFVNNLFHNGVVNQIRMAVKESEGK